MTIIDIEGYYVKTYSIYSAIRGRHMVNIKIDASVQQEDLNALQAQLGKGKLQVVIKK